MATQYEKRKAKEEKKDSSELSELALDIRQLKNGKFELVAIHYNLDTKEAKVSEVKTIDRGTGILFLQKKTALKTIAKLK